MNKAQKLLYILPDLAYTAELIPTKKPNSFSISDFHQVNGELIKDEQFVEKNLEKLATKFQAGDYQVILPDFLFTNTIVSVEESSETKVKEVLKNKILPELGLNTKDYYLETFVLTKHKGAFKVQLSALEKSLIEPLMRALAKDGLNIVDIMPLSWTVKSVVSLEPSITILELGNFIYLAEQYIGMDQCSSVAIEKIDDLVETIKTLKGSEASIQTIYLLTSESVEEKIKTGVKDVLPLQQLSVEKDKENEMSNFIKQIIEAGAKTMSIPDYLMPKFSVGKSSVVASKVKDEVTSDVPMPVVIDAEEETVEELPKPSEPDMDDKKTGLQEDKKEEDEKEEEVLEDEESKSVMFGDDEPVASVEPPETEAEDDDKMTGKQEEDKKEEEDYKEVDLSQFAEGGNKKDDDKMTGKQEDKKSDDKMTGLQEDKKAEEKPKEVIKDKSGVNGMLKMFFIGLVSFFVTIGIGLALGLGYLSMTKNKTEEAPVVEVVEQVEEVATPTPEPVAINKEELSALIVNATKISGHASETAGLLDEAGYGSTDASNAEGEYEAGVYLLMTEEDQNLLKIVSKDTGLDLVYKEGIETEDPSGDYDFVIVLAE